jgi:hypothetical protein
MYLFDEMKCRILAVVRDLKCGKPDMIVMSGCRVLILY